MLQKQNTQATSLPEVFTFNPSNQPIRVEMINDEPWFVAKDVCDALGIEKHRDATSRLEDDERGSLLMDTLGGKQQLSAVNESGMYNLIFQSRKPEAKVFRKWVTSEVLPAIRKTGKYAMSKRTAQRDGDFIDLRHVPYEFRQIGNSQVRTIIHNDIDWYSVNDVQLGIGVRTSSHQVAKQLNRERTLAVKILIFGNTHPAWFTPITGVKLMLGGSRKVKNGKQNVQQLQLTIGGLV